MRSEFYLTDPDSADATLTMTMPLREWKELREFIRDHHNKVYGLPFAFTEALSGLVREAEIRFKHETAKSERSHD